MVAALAGVSAVRDPAGPLVGWPGAIVPDRSIAGTTTGQDALQNMLDQA